jgi:hypothetical protein
VLQGLLLRVLLLALYVAVCCWQHQTDCWLQQQRQQHSLPLLLLLLLL